MPRTTVATRSRVTTLKDEGWSLSAIAKEVRLAKSTVYDICKRYSDRQHHSDLLSTGRPKLLDDRAERRLVRNVVAADTSTAVALRADLEQTTGVTVSAQTVRRSLRRLGLKAAPKRKRPLLTARHRALRYDWAKAHKTWTVEDWKKVVFSDESKFNRIGSDGRKWCWKKSGAGVQPHTVTPTIKHGGGSVMIWGCMSWKGVGNLARIEGKMDQWKYQEILAEELIDTVDWQDLDDDWIFQQDNDPKHTAHSTRAWFETKNIKVLEWAPQSPDMNPIEHLWEEAKRRLQRLPQHPKSVDELWEKLLDIYGSIEVEVVQKLIASMPRRVESLLAAKGGYTKY